MCIARHNLGNMLYLIHREFCYKWVVDVDVDVDALRCSTLRCGIWKMGRLDSEMRGFDFGDLAEVGLWLNLTGG